MKNTDYPNTLEKLLKFAYNIETEGDVELITDANYEHSQQNNAVSLPKNIFKKLVEDFECYRVEIEKVLADYADAGTEVFTSFIQRELDFVPMALWSEAGMLILPFAPREQAVVTEITMSPKPTLENKAKVVSLVSARFKQIDAKKAEEDQRIEEMLKNPVVSLDAGQGYFIVKEDGKKADIISLEGEPKVVDVNINASEYALCLAAAELERKILYLREKYEFESIDWTKEPSYGIPAYEYEPDETDEPAPVSLEDYIKWRKHFDVFLEQFQRWLNNEAVVIFNFDHWYMDDGRVVLSGGSKRDRSALALVFTPEYDPTELTKIFFSFRGMKPEEFGDAEVRHVGWFDLNDGTDCFSILYQMLSAKNREETFALLEKFNSQFAS